MNTQNPLGRVVHGFSWSIISTDCCYNLEYLNEKKKILLFIYHFNEMIVVYNPYILNYINIIVYYPNQHLWFIYSFSILSLQILLCFSPSTF